MDELSDPRWREFEAIYRNYTQLVETQNREKLDKVVNPELVQLVVSKLNYRFSLNNGVLRLEDNGFANYLSAIQIAQQYGADVIEEILEKGSVRVN